MENDYTFKNITLKEYIINYLPYVVKHYFKPIEIFLKYSKIYKNFFSVMLKISKNDFPIHGILRNGEKIILQNQYHCHLISNNVKEEYKIENDFITISKKEIPQIKLELGKNNGDILGVFFNEEYNSMQIKDKVVVDIGANIGDSSIYFALKGARKIIAMEPFPKNFEIAKKNIITNGLSEKIIILNVGCSSKNGEILLDPNKEGAGVSTNILKDGIKIPSITLEKIINEYQIPNCASLKIDCEGCEIDIIKNAKKETLQKFSSMQIEYHYGYMDLKKKLEECGFDVKTTIPFFLKNTQAGKTMCLGYIYANK